MARLPPAQAEDELHHLAQQFTQWRQRRATSRGRIPQALWDQAVALTHRLPLSRVAKQLGLCPQRLRKQRKELDGTARIPSLSAALPFVEGHPAWRGPTAEVEVQRLDGQRLRLTVYEVRPALAVLLRTFMEHH